VADGRDWVDAASPAERCLAGVLRDPFGASNRPIYCCKEFQ
jgi:hypothetical protein